jgi:hypothetical protein
MSDVCCIFVVYFFVSTNYYYLQLPIDVALIFLVGRSRWLCGVGLFLASCVTHAAIVYLYQRT